MPKPASFPRPLRPMTFRPPGEYSPLLFIRSRPRTRLRSVDLVERHAVTCVSDFDSECVGDGLTKRNRDMDFWRVGVVGISDQFRDCRYCSRIHLKDQALYSPR